MVKLQVALDFTDLGEAMHVASLVCKYVDIIEVGTPLIKSEGIKAVSIIRKTFPDKEIVADLKTMDTGALEADLAFSNGADIITVLGAADDKTILGAIESARRHGKKVMVDLINCERDLSAFDIDYELWHLGIDQQDGRSVLREKKTKHKLAVAGGINKATLISIAKSGASLEIVIVGSAITKSDNPAKAAKDIANLIVQHFNCRLDVTDKF